MYNFTEDLHSLFFRPTENGALDLDLLKSFKVQRWRFSRKSFVHDISDQTKNNLLFKLSHILKLNPQVFTRNHGVLILVKYGKISHS
jgi:hypothetical protein